MLPSKQDIKRSALSAYDNIRPYEKYIVAAMVLFVIDHFVLKGKLQDRIQGLFSALGDRLILMLDGLINKLTGVDEGGK